MRGIMEIKLKDSTVKALKDLDSIYPGTDSLEDLANFVIQREWGLQYYTLKRTKGVKSGD